MKALENAQHGQRTDCSVFKSKIRSPPNATMHDLSYELIKTGQGRGRPIKTESRRNVFASLPQSITRHGILRCNSVGRRGKQLKNPLVDRRPRAAWMDRLEANVIRASVPEQLNALADGALIAPGHVGIDEAIGPAARSVILSEAQSAPVVGVIRELDVG